MRKVSTPTGGAAASPTASPSAAASSSSRPTGRYPSGSMTSPMNSPTGPGTPTPPRSNRRAPAYGRPSGRGARSSLPPKRRRERALPEPDALLRREIHLIARLHVEGGVPLVDVARGTVDAEVRRAVRIGQDLLAHLTIAILGTPDLREGEEEALVAGIAVEHRRLLTVQRGVIGLESDGEAGQVADILAHRQLAV